MREVGAFEAKNTLGALLTLVEQGEEIIITRRGKSVARLVPNVSGFDRMQAMDAMRRIRARAKAFKVGPFNWDEWKSYRDEGRK